MLRWKCYFWFLQKSRNRVFVGIEDYNNMKQKESKTLFTLILENEKRQLVSRYVSNEFETSIVNSREISGSQKAGYYLSRILLRIWSDFLKAKFIRLLFTRFVRLFLSNPKNYLVIFMGPYFPKCLPFFFRKGRKAIYLFDPWPKHHREIVRFVNDFSVDYIFVPSSQATINLNNILGKKNVFWIPEGINPENYNYLPFVQKDIDVLAMGRKYQKYHDVIVSPLSKANINYRYSTIEKMVFPDYSSLIEGLARTKISICFPANITHPERTGGIGTITNRYLQSIVSKCLIVGIAPKEMIDVFGYNPIIEVNFDDPVGQIIDILANFENYEELIDKNYKMVVNNHTWKNRWEAINSKIS